MKRIYLDNAASTPVKPEVLEAMRPYEEDLFGNPASLHSLGQEATKAVNAVRSQIAKIFGCHDMQVIFTASATEGNNLALKGTWEKLGRPKGNLVISSVEHDSVLQVAQYLGREGVTIRQAPVDEHGVVKIEELKQLIDDETWLVSIMYVNNEVGAIQPIAEIGKYLEQVNQKRKQKIMFHTDAAQGIGHLPCIVDELKVDYLTFSGHKLFAPKGSGILYVRDKQTLQPQIIGGGQEFGIRSGTLNVPAIVGLGKALELIDIDNKTVREYNALVYEILQQGISGITFNSHPDYTIPGMVNIRVPGVKSQEVVIALDQKGIAVSAGSACRAGAINSSHVLMAQGLSAEAAQEGIRLSFADTITKRQLRTALRIITEVYSQLRT